MTQGEITIKYFGNRLEIHSDDGNQTDEDIAIQMAHAIGILTQSNLQKLTIFDKVLDVLDAYAGNTDFPNITPEQLN
jgi:hypothetical protein